MMMIQCRRRVAVRCCSFRADVRHGCVHHYLCRHSVRWNFVDLQVLLSVNTV